MSVRHWPAIDIQQPGACSDPDGLEGAILAALDDAGVSAVQELPFGWRIFFTTTGSRAAAMATLAAWKPELVVSARRRLRRGLGAAEPGESGAGARRAGSDCAAVARKRRGDPATKPGRTRTLSSTSSFSRRWGSAPAITPRRASARHCSSRSISPAGACSMSAPGPACWRSSPRASAPTSVLAVDDDPDALESARENLELNGIASGKAEGSAAVELRQADFRQLKAGLFGVVTANLTGGLLVRGADELLGAVSPDGRLILSGITRDEEASVRARFEAHLPLLARVEEDDWIGLLLGSRRVNAEG